jgi:hypothetical protein
MPRTPSQNVLFVGQSPGDDQCEPPGRSLAERIESHLRDEGYPTGEFDNWRDCGWSLCANLGEARIEVAMASAATRDEWMLQVYCASDVGLIGRLLGRPFVDRSEEVLRVARAIHECLRSCGCSNFRWRLDGPPDDSCPAEPVDPRASRRGS